MIGGSTGEPVAAPDIAGAIEAWRVWRVVSKDGSYRLASLVKPTVWPAGEALVADCLHTRTLLDWIRRKPRHDAPEAVCECGIYAAELDDIGQYLAEIPLRLSAARVFGRVSLWGLVVECERGFRASHAYPQRIYVPGDAGGRGGRRRQELVEDLLAYGIPVESLAAGYRDATAELEHRQAV